MADAEASAAAVAARVARNAAGAAVLDAREDQQDKDREARNDGELIDGPEQPLVGKRALNVAYSHPMV